MKATTLILRMVVALGLVIAGGVLLEVLHGQARWAGLLVMASGLTVAVRTASREGDGR